MRPIAHTPAPVAGALLLAMLALGACGTSATTSSSSGDAAIADAGPSDAASNPDAVILPPAGAGTGAVNGDVEGSPFGKVAAALWAGAADDPATTVVYLFSSAIACSELAMPGWDKLIADGTKVIEMKAIGTSPGAYKVVTTVTPAAGEASVNFTLSSRSGTPKEDGSTAGSVTLASLAASSAATGSFTLTFGASTVTGSFDAAYCPGGHEP